MTELLVMSINTTLVTYESLIIMRSTVTKRSGELLIMSTMRMSTAHGSETLGFLSAFAREAIREAQFASEAIRPDPDNSALNQVTYT